MTWEKLPFWGGLAAVLLTVTFIRIIFVVPKFDYGFWDIYIYVAIGILDFYLIAYKESPYWRMVCIGLIIFSLSALVFMQFYPEAAGEFLQPYFVIGD